MVIGYHFSRGRGRDIITEDVDAVIIIIITTEVEDVVFVVIINICQIMVREEEEEV